MAKRKKELSQKERLKERLKEVIEEIDEEGLLFLLEQSQVLIHNAQIEQLNKERAQLTVGKSKGGEKTKPTGGGAAVEDAGDGKTFFLVLNGTRKIMNVDEMRQLVKICYKADSKRAAVGQMYKIMSRERADILGDAGIPGPSAPALGELFDVLRGKFKLKDQ